MNKFVTVPYELNPSYIQIAEFIQKDDAPITIPLSYIDWVFESKDQAIQTLEAIIADIKEQ